MYAVLKTVAQACKTRQGLLMLSLMAFFYVTGNGGVWFVLPLIAEGLLKDYMLVGLLIAIPNFTAMFLDVPLGGLSDYWGRKKMLALGMILMAVLGLALSSISTVPHLIAYLILFGIANQLIFISGRAYLMDISPQGKTSEYFGIFEAFGQVGFAIGPALIGYAVADGLGAGLPLTGLFYVITCLLSMLVIFSLKETVTQEGVVSSMKKLLEQDKLIKRELVDFKELSGDGLVILLLTFILIVADGLIWTMEPLYATLGIDSATIGLVLSMFVVPYMLFMIPAGIIADKFGKTKIIPLGLAIGGIFLMVFGYTREPTVLLASAFIATAGLAIVRPSIGGLLTSLVEKKHKGGIVGVWNMSEDFGYVIGPIIGGLVAEYYRNVGAAFIMMGLVILLSAPVALLAFKGGKK